MTRYYLDTEFLEDGKTIDLISIALVHEGGSYYYAGNSQCDWARVTGDDWLREHVVPHLPDFDSGLTRSFWKTKAEIGRDLLGLLGVVRGMGIQEQPEIWADFASYDWVAFCQIWGRMIDLPAGLPMFCMDLMQDLRQRGIHRSELPKQASATEHDALQDALWLRKAHRFAQGLNW